MLQLQPGVVAATPTATRSRSAAAATTRTATYVDGVPVQAGLPRRRASSSSAGHRRSTSAPTPSKRPRSPPASSSAEFGNAQVGRHLDRHQDRRQQVQRSLWPTRPTSRSASTTASGSTGSTGSFGGPLVRSRLTFALGGTLEGSRSMEDGHGQPGRSRSSLQAGIDTTVSSSVPTTRDSGTSPPRPTPPLVPVYNFAVSRGECSFADAVRRHAAPTPRHQRSEQLRASTARASGSGDGPLDLSAHRQAELLLRHRLAARRSACAASSRAARPADLDVASRSLPTTLYNPGNLSGFRNWNHVATLNWTQNLSKSTERALALETYCLVPAGPHDRRAADPESELGTP